MKRAFCLIREQPVYRRDVFVRGLQAAGYEVGPPHQIGSGVGGNVLVIWNRYGGLHETAKTFEREGGIVVVAENGYLGNDRNNRTRYALARGGHNGSGEWPVGDAGRWEALGIPLKPWREPKGGYVLVCPNRSFGMPGFIMPVDWPQNVCKQLAKYTKYPIKLRPHPGNDPPSRPLSADLADARAVVIWSSSAGLDALLQGIPVFRCAPWWVAGAGDCGQDLSQIDKPNLARADRYVAMVRTAWAQWHIDEIENGTAFQHLLHGPHSFV